MRWNSKRWIAMRWTTLAFVLLTACAGAESPGASDVALPSASPIAAAPTESPVPTPSPQPAPDVVGDGSEVDNTCSVDADCAVKNVGSCCGYMPACVHKDSPTFPERVKAECEAKQMSSICGFQEPAGCACVDGQCASTGSATGGGELK